MDLTKWLSVLGCSFVLTVVGLFLHFWELRLEYCNTRETLQKVLAVISIIFLFFGAFASIPCFLLSLYDNKRIRSYNINDLEHCRYIDDLLQQPVSMQRLLLSKMGVHNISAQQWAQDEREKFNLDLDCFPSPYKDISPYSVQKEYDELMQGRREAIDDYRFGKLSDSEYSDILSSFDEL
jgi:hypothetical protein